MAEPSATDLPVVSVVIPVRNEASTILRTVDAALDQDYAGEIEVVVADGASTDDTRRVVRSHVSPQVRLVANPARVTPAGLNAAIRESRGDVIVRCDAHAVLPAGYVRRAVEILTETGADNVGGVQRAVGGSLMQRAIALAMSSPIGVGDARFHYGGPPGPVDTVYLGVFPRSVFDRVGWFDESLVRNQDYEFNVRIREAGGLVYFHPDLEVEYTPRPTLGALARQYYQYGMWKRTVVRRHPQSVRLRQLAPPLLVIGLATSLVAAVAGAGWWAAILPGAWLVALLAAAAVELARRRTPAAMLLPVVAATMHLSWGVGFLVGVQPPLSRA